MKRILFVLVSAILAGTSFASNLSRDIVAKVSNSGETVLVQQDQNLILEMPTSVIDNADWHYSHSSHVSHGSHGSHGSHSSHVSHYSSRF